MTAGNPVVVGTSTTNSAERLEYMHKSFYANGLFWVFFSDATNLVYYTSPDGTTWTVGGSSPVRACTLGYYMDIWFDGTYLSYVYCNNTANVAISYRSGIPNSNGSITWNAVEQVAVAAVSGTQYEYPSICVDSNGYVWITYNQTVSSAQYPYVTKSGNLGSTGTWGTTPTGFPYKISGTNSNSVTRVVPLSASGQVVVVWGNAYGNSPVYLIPWYGSGWGAIVNTQYNIAAGQFIDAVAYGNKVSIIYLVISTFNINYALWNYSNNSMSADVTVQSSTTSTTAPVIVVNSSTGDLYVFWMGSPTANHIYYKMYTYATTTWDTNPTDWITDSTIAYYQMPSVFYQVNSTYIGYLYLSTTSTYSVKFAYLLVSGATPINVSDSGSGSDVVTFINNIIVESGSGSDIVVEGLPIAESGLGTDVTVIGIPINDVGSGTEIESVVAALVLSESGVGSEVVLFQVTNVITDTALGSDVVVIGLNLFDFTGGPSVVVQGSLPPVLITLDGHILLKVSTTGYILLS